MRVAASSFVMADFVLSMDIASRTFKHPWRKCHLTYFSMRL